MPLTGKIFLKSKGIKFLKVGRVASFLFWIFLSNQVYGAREIRIGIPNGIGTVEPGRQFYAQDLFASELIFESLLHFNYRNELEADLAEKWEFDQKKSILWLDLVKGRKFSDGSVLTPNDVRNSLIELCQPGRMTSIPLQGVPKCGASSIEKSIQIMPPNRIGIELSIDPSKFLYILARGKVQIFKHVGGHSYIGTGPYRVVKLEEGQLHLEPNRYFQNKEGYSIHDALVFLHVSEGNLEQQLRSHSIDMAFMYLTSLSSGIKGIDYTEIQFLPTLTHTLVLNPNRPEFKNQYLRRSLLKEIALDSRIMRCLGKVEKPTGFIPPGIGGAFPTQENISKLEIKPIRLDRGKRFKVDIIRNEGRKNLCEEAAIVDDFKKYGLTAQFVYTKDNDEFDKLTKGSSNPAAYTDLYLFSGRDAGSSLSYFTKRVDPDVYFYYVDETIESLLNIAEKEPLLSDRFKLYKEINARILDKAVALPLYHVEHLNYILNCYKDLSQGEIRLNPNSFAMVNYLDDSSCPKEPIH